MLIREKFLFPLVTVLGVSLVGCGTEELNENNDAAPVAMDADALAETNTGTEPDSDLQSDSVVEAEMESEGDEVVMFGRKPKPAPTPKPTLLGTLKSTADSRYVKYTIPRIKNTDMTQCAITDLRSNEVDDSGQAGDKPGDFIVHSALSFSVRAEALATGTGRVYDITVTCTRSSGNTTHLYQVKVTKPKSPRIALLDEGDFE